MNARAHVGLEPVASRARTRVAPPRHGYSPAEAASSIGISRDLFDEHVLPELRVVRIGRRIVVPVRELERWLERSAARYLDV